MKRYSFLAGITGTFVFAIYSFGNAMHQKPLHFDDDQRTCSVEFDAQNQNNSAQLLASKQLQEIKLTNNAQLLNACEELAKKTISIKLAIDENNMIVDAAIIRTGQNPDEIQIGTRSLNFTSFIHENKKWTRLGAQKTTKPYGFNKTPNKSPLSSKFKTVYWFCVCPEKEKHDIRQLIKTISSQIGETDGGDYFVNYLCEMNLLSLE